MKDSTGTSIETDRPDRATPRLWAWLIIPLLVFVAYWPAMTGGFVWDDDQYVYENPLITEPGGFADIWASTRSPQYYPLVFTTFRLEWRMWGDHTTGYHLVNLLLHSLCALLLWRVLRTLGLPGAWWAAAVFALHPIQVESVAWITERKNVLSGVFYLLAMASFWRFAVECKWKPYVACLLLYVCALLSKTSTVMLPAVLVLLQWWAGRLWHKRNLLVLLPLFGMSLVMGLLTVWYEKHAAGAHGIEWSAGRAERLANAGWILWFYLSKLLVPIRLTFNYPRWEVDAGTWTSFIPLAGAALVALVLLIRRSPYDRALIAGLGAYAVTLFPVLGFFNVYFMRYAFVADHFAYLPSMAAIAWLVCGAAWCVRDKPARQAQARVIGVLVLVVLAGLTWRQSRVFADAETLYLDILRKNPGSWLAHNNLGNLLLARGDHAEAVHHFRQAREANPIHQETYYNEELGLVALGRWEDAMNVLRDGIRNRKAKDNIRISLELARLLSVCPHAELRDPVEALLYAEAVNRTTKGENAEVLDVLATAYASAGRFPDAQRTAREAVRLAEAVGDEEAVRDYRARLLLYESHRPYHVGADEPRMPNTFSGESDRP